ncbi:MAG: transposase [Gemmataceae bacterium]
MRETRGLEIAARMRVVRDGPLWSVPSTTGVGKYRVDPTTPSCSCEDFATTGRPCKHVYAVRFVMEREAGKHIPDSPARADEPVRSSRPTYKQNWPAYVKAQRTERDRFQVLLADLCRGVEEPPRAKTGRKPVPLADAVFACCFKVWAGLSARRFDCDLRDATEAGHLSRPLHPHKISALMENPALTPVLKQLVEVSSQPLAAVEVDFAVDSTGFAGSRFARWFDHKHGTVKTKQEWVKLQAMVGVRTNVITAVEVLEQDGADSPFLPGLVERTAANGFRIAEVSADKGYSTVEAHEVVARHGGIPFIAFKRVATGWSGGLYAKMLGYFQYRRQEFLQHYHKRSNVEATFSALKRKFGDSLRSKTKAAMLNEVLCKCVCFNVSVLIHEQEELGIGAEFWGAAEECSAAILQFPSAR